MVVSLSLMRFSCYCSSDLIERKSRCLSYRPQSKSTATSASRDILLSRRLAVISSGASLVLVSSISCGLVALPIKAEEEKNLVDQKDEGDGDVFGTIKSIFDPNEKTKTGKLLPKAYLKSAREVVKTLRESLEEDTRDVSKFRRTADAAKESIRQYLSSWKGQPAVVAECVQSHKESRNQLSSRSCRFTRTPQRRDHMYKRYGSRDGLPYVQFKSKYLPIFQLVAHFCFLGTSFYKYLDHVYIVLILFTLFYI